MTEMSKSAYARHRNRSPACVSQWIEGGWISGDAIVGAGRNARINVELADRQLAARLDPGQALGNGARTKQSAVLSPRANSAATPPQRPPEAQTNDVAPDTAEAELDPGSPDYQAQRARLVKAQADAQEMKNAIARGDLGSKAEREQAWGEIIAGAKSIILAVPGRVRDAHPELTATQVKTIDAELRIALTTLSTGGFLA